MTHGRNDKELVVGLIFILVGGAWCIMSRAYPAGSAMQMGPGYFPTLISGVLVFLGGINAVRGLRSRMPERAKPLALRPLALLFAGVVLFGLLLNRFGLLISITALVICCSFAGARFRPLETGVILVVLIVMASGLFVYGLDLPFTYLLPH